MGIAAALPAASGSGSRTHATATAPQPTVELSCLPACLWQGPAVTMVRRHARGGEGSQHYGPALQTVSGNYVAAKRKGVVGGVDYQLTGVVRFVQVGVK